ncbi:MAG: glycoside hydrolase family 43 protein [Treponema sp.]|jgi:xylan 1,4-beta-xylosidase|nr:glycoside hydrolase family 43 protein [Treponema sp.]
MSRIVNPVLPGFHPDPSILRAGDWYYLANSTFEWYPGVELHRSRDLARWESLPSPLAEKRLLDMEGERSSCGVWAPCLSYGGGLFWLVYTNVRTWNAGPWKDCSNYLTWAPSIEGPWADPVYLGSSGFDPSLFHDDDGSLWLLNMEWDYRQREDPEGAQFSGILLRRYSPEERKCTGPVKKIFTGSPISCVEGPHLYKREGWYYLLTAEGGTVYGHAATVARSRSIEGPYEVHPHNPLISSRGRPEHPLQKAGHGSWCESPGGRTYLAYLCGRPLPGTRYCVLGRETAIAELVWHDGWPYVKGEDGGRQNYPALRFDSPGPPEESSPPPKAPAEEGGQGAEAPGDMKAAPGEGRRVYTFTGKALHGDFKTLRSPADPLRYSLTARPGYLRLRGGQSPVSPYGQTLLARRQEHFSFNAETCLECNPASFQELAGLCWRYDERNHYLLALTWDENRGRVLSILSMRAGHFSREDGPAVPEGPVYLGLEVREHRGIFRYSGDGRTFSDTGPALDSGILSDEYDSLGFTGAFVGIFCIDTSRYEAEADFAYLSYEPVETSR